MSYHRYNNDLSFWENVLIQGISALISVLLFTAIGLLFWRKPDSSQIVAIAGKGGKISTTYYYCRQNNSTYINCTNNGDDVVDLPVSNTITLVAAAAKEYRSVDFFLYDQKTGNYVICNEGEDFSQCQPITVPQECTMVGASLQKGSSYYRIICENNGRYYEWNENGSFTDLRILQGYRFIDIATWDYSSQTLYCLDLSNEEVVTCPQN